MKHSLILIAALCMLMLGCTTPKHLATPRMGTSSQVSNPNIVIRNFDVPLTSMDRHRHLSEFRAVFEDAIQRNPSLNKVQQHHSQIYVDINIRPGHNTYRTWLLDIPFFFPYIGFWPITPWWGKTYIDISLSVNVPQADNSNFRFNDKDNYFILFYPYYRGTYKITENFRDQYKDMFNEISGYDFIGQWNGNFAHKLTEPPQPQFAHQEPIQAAPEPMESTLKRGIPSSELLSNIPESNTTQKNTYVLIIGNEDYQSRQRGLTTEQNVDFAENDAQVFAEYCKKTLGIPERQIRLLIDATAAEMHQGVAWLSNLADVEEGNAKLIFYYSGHGLPHEQTRDPYLIPVDVSGSNPEFGLKLGDVYTELTKHPSQQVVAIIDACFSGGARNQGLVAMKAVRVRPRESAITNNLVVLSSSSGEEASGVFRDKGHGYLTYFLLRKLQETAGDVTLEELSEYLRSNVRRETGLDGKIQTPQVLVSPTVTEEWGSWRLK